MVQQPMGCKTEPAWSQAALLCRLSRMCCPGHQAATCCTLLRCATSLPGHAADAAGLPARHWCAGAAHCSCCYSPSTRALAKCGLFRHQKTRTCCLRVACVSIWDATSLLLCSLQSLKAWWLCSSRYLYGDLATASAPWLSLREARTGAARSLAGAALHRSPLHISGKV